MAASRDHTETQPEHLLVALIDQTDSVVGSVLRKLGARPGGVSVHDFFDATRVIGAHPKVKAVDLTEYDPSLEIGDLASLTAGRWFGELLAGFEAR